MVSFIHAEKCGSGNLGFLSLPDISARIRKCDPENFGEHLDVWEKQLKDFASLRERLAARAEVLFFGSFFRSLFR